MTIYRLNATPEHVAVECRRFSHYIDNYRYWFLLHIGLHSRTEYVVTEWDSRKAICAITPLEHATSRGDDLLAARNAIDAKIISVGGAKAFRDALAKQKPFIETRAEFLARKNAK